MGDTADPLLSHLEPLFECQGSLRPMARIDLALQNRGKEDGMEQRVDLHPRWLNNGTRSSPLGCFRWTMGCIAKNS